MTLRRSLALLLVLAILGPPTHAVADIAVNGGVYTATLSAAVVAGKQIQDIAIADPVTGTRVTVTGTAMNVNIAGGSVTFSGSLPSGSNVIGHIICDSGCSSAGSPAFGAAFPTTGTPVGFTDGTNMVAVRARTSTPGSSDSGAVVRPFMPCDGANCQPAGDSAARSIHVTIDNGSSAPTESGNVTLGASNIAETISINYGQAITTPSTMTLGTNGNGMRATYALAGQQMVQLNAPKGDWKMNFATATGTGNTSVVAALGAGLTYCLTDAFVSNNSATNTEFKLIDDVGGTNTALSAAISAPANAGNNFKPTTPICFSANKAAGFAAVVGVSTLSVTFNGYKTKE